MTSFANSLKKRLAWNQISVISFSCYPYGRINKKINSPFLRGYHGVSSGVTATTNKNLEPNLKNEDCYSSMGGIFYGVKGWLVWLPKLNSTFLVPDRL